MPVRPSIRCLVFAVAALTNPVLIDLNLGNVSVLVTACSRSPGAGWTGRRVASRWRSPCTVRPTLGLVLIW